MVVPDDLEVLFAHEPSAGLLGISPNSKASGVDGITAEIAISAGDTLQRLLPTYRATPRSGCVSKK